jgi:ABC-type multidrug transport system ATPase subunit
MKETVLKSVMRLFAIVSQVHSIDETEAARKVVESYLKHVIRNNKIKQYLIMFDFYQNSLREREIRTGEKQLSLLSVKSVIICDQLNQWLEKKHRILVTTHILEIISLTHNYNPDDVDFIRTIAHSLKIEELIFDDCVAFIFEKLDQMHLKKNVLVVNRDYPSEEFRYLFRNISEGSLLFLYIEEAEFCLFRKTSETDKIYFNDELIDFNRTYVFKSGTVLKSPIMGTLFYSDVLKVILHDTGDKKVVFCVENLSYNFKDKTPAIAPMSFSEEAGQLIGIMGGSGVGKSTLINLLNGSIIPATGSVLLNGYDIHKDKAEVEGLIGYVPQDDLLIEELTVFQNLYLSSRLCFSDLSKENIVRKVTRMLQSLGLSKTKDLKVGSPLETTISGGQRKRLNIALELIREPQVLFVDEPTSGLSSSDSDLVMDLLKKQSYKGKLIFINIHQPSAESFRKLDKLIILDKGGKIVFMGNPLESVIYLKSFSQLVDADEGVCSTCGNIDSDQLLTIIDSKQVNEVGDYTQERQISPDDWYANFAKHQNRDYIQAGELKLDLPPKHFSPPSAFNQFKIFGLRNLLTRLADKQYLLINLLEAPVLALILGWFTRYNAGNESDPSAYVFSENINLPAFIFMSVIVALFLGLMVSAEEIIRDRKLIKRERFLNLSQFAYYNSKVFYLAVLLALQMLMYVAISNSILEIKGMFFHYWLMLWLTSMVSGMAGLILSSILNTVVAIYIVIPIMLIPQILLGGAFIRFDKLNSKITNPRYVPFIGDIMPSRWAYEALAVHQFVNNRYEKQLFEYDRELSNISFTLNYYIPQLFDLLSDIRSNISSNHLQEYEVKQKVELLISELDKLKINVLKCQNELENVKNQVFNIATASAIEEFLNCCKENYIVLFDNSVNKRDARINELTKVYGNHSGLLDFKNQYYNENLASTVLNKNEPVKIETMENQIICRADPLFYIPESGAGRSQFYAAEKRVGKYFLATYWANFIVLFFIVLACYLFLVFNVFVKLSEFLGTVFNINIIKTTFKRLTLILKPLLKK